MADIRSILDPLPVPASVKADAWDAYNQAASAADLKTRLDKLPLANGVRASLWDAKNAEAPAAATPGFWGTLGNDAANMWHTAVALTNRSDPAGQIAAMKGLAAPNIEAGRQALDAYHASLDPNVSGLERLGHGGVMAVRAIEAAIPGAGPLAAQSGRDFDAGNYGAASARALELFGPHIAGAAAPAVAGLAGKVTPAVADAASGLRAIATDPAVFKAGINVIPKGQAALDLMAKARDAFNAAKAARAAPAEAAGVPVAAPLPASFVPGVAVRPPLSEFAPAPAVPVAAQPPAPASFVAGRPVRPPVTPALPDLPTAAEAAPDSGIATPPAAAAMQTPPPEPAPTPAADLLARSRAAFDAAKAARNNPQQLTDALDAMKQRQMEQRQAAAAAAVQTPPPGPQPPAAPPAHAAAPAAPPVPTAPEADLLARSRAAFDAAKAQRLADAADQQAAYAGNQASEIEGQNRIGKADRFADYLTANKLAPTPDNLALAAKALAEHAAPSADTVDMIHDRMGYQVPAAAPAETPAAAAPGLEQQLRDSIAAAQARKAAAQNAPEPAAAQPAAGPPPGTLIKQDPNSISVDPARFQFKRDTGGLSGTGDKLKAIDTYNQDLGGTLNVWHDPADGKTYIVNGHHRLELAQRAGAPSVDTRYIDAASAQEARAKGALMNIAEDQGTPLDAAKLFRDTGIGPEDLKAQGIALNGKTARAGLGLSKLDQGIFDQVVSGDIPEANASVIGEMLPGRFADQRAVIDSIDKAAARGKAMTPAQIGESIRVGMRPGNDITETQDTLFGPESTTRSLFAETGEISDYVRKQLASEKRTFGAVSSAGAAERLGRAGNVLNAEENARIAAETNQAQQVYDKLSGMSGPVSDALASGARDLAAGGNSNAIKQATYESVRRAISATVFGTEGRVSAGSAAGDSAGSGEAARPASGSLFDAPVSAKPIRNVRALQNIAAQYRNADPVIENAAPAQAQIPGGSWVRPDGTVEPLRPNESHDGAIIRLLGAKNAKTVPSTAAFNNGWIRQRGDGIQTPDLREPGNLTAFNLASQYVKPGESVFVDHPGNPIEVPPRMGKMFFDNPYEISGIRAPVPSPGLLARIKAAALKNAQANLTAHR